MPRFTSPNSKTFVVMVKILWNIFGSNKFQKEVNRTLVLPHSGNQPSLTEKFNIVYGSVEQWFSDISYKMIVELLLLENWTFFTYYSDTSIFYWLIIKFK